MTEIDMARTHVTPESEPPKRPAPAQPSNPAPDPLFFIAGGPGEA